jgi:transposase
VSCGTFTQMTANVFDMTKVVKRAYKYRFYPTPEQAAELTRTFGCVRKVWNLALETRTTAWHQRHEHVSYLQSSALLTQWKRSDDLAFLAEVSCVPLQQALRHLQSAYARFWQKQARYPRYKSRKKSRAAAEYTRSAFRYRDGQLHLRWYPSSKTCSACGRTVSSLPLGVREWDCAACGARHDRDINAAVNIKAAGLAVLACGAGRRRAREPSRAGGRP